MRVGNISEQGQVQSISVLGELKDRPNSILSTWDGKGYEKSPGVGMINFCDEKGITKLVYLVSEVGRTVNVFTEPFTGPNHEDTIGKAATMDDIAEAMDLGKSVRNILLGGLISAPFWWIVFQMLGAIAR